MGRKKILIVSSLPLYPLNSMSKVRVVNQLKGLSANHEIDLLFLYSRSSDIKETIKIAGNYCHKVIPVKTFTQSNIFKVFKKIFLNKLFKTISFPLDHFVPSNKLTSGKIADLVDQGGYDVVITHYWHSAGFLRYLDQGIFKCIDSHYAVEENLVNFSSGSYRHIAGDSYRKLLMKEHELQKKYFGIADLVIANSSTSGAVLRESLPMEKLIVIPNGQDLDFFTCYKEPPGALRGKNLLFYGALSSQFNSKALQRILERIYPGIRKSVPEVRMIILGSNPPEWLNEYRNREDITVTGYVKDIRPWLADSYLSLIPLESGSGFRGRMVELMAMKVPVIGTHNALDCLELENGKQGFIIDDDEGIIDTAIRLFRDKELRDRIAENARNFALIRFSIEATFGRLSEYLSKI